MKSAQKMRNAEIASKIMKNIQILQRKYMERVDPADLDEVNRRLSMLTFPFVSSCIDRVSKRMNYLRIYVPSISLVGRAINLLHIYLIINPEFGKTKCSSVQKRIARIIFNTIVQIKEERFKLIKEGCIKKQKAEKQHHKKKGPKKEVSIVEHAEIIGAGSYEEFVGSTPGARGKKSEQTVK